MARHGRDRNHGVCRAGVRWGVWDVPGAVSRSRTSVRSRRRAAAASRAARATRGSRRRSTSLDGLLFSGGSDLDPAEYGAGGAPGDDRHAAASGTAASSRCSTAALERDMPVLAVCRGSQVLNVARGGDLVQHLPDVVGDEKHKHTPGVFADHDVESRRSRLGAHARRARAGQVAPPSRLRRASATGSRVGVGRRRHARGARGPVERFALGVLWHPEAGEDRALFEALVEEARAYRARLALASRADRSSADESGVRLREPRGDGDRARGTRWSNRVSTG